MESGKVRCFIHRMFYDVLALPPLPHFLPQHPTEASPLLPALLWGSQSESRCLRQRRKVRLRYFARHHPKLRITVAHVFCQQQESHFCQEDEGEGVVCIRRAAVEKLPAFFVFFESRMQPPSSSSSLTNVIPSFDFISEGDCAT